MANPDGTIQVAAPTRSAFAPQPTQAPPMQAPAAPVASTGPAGAIQALVAALASAFAPKAITQRGAKLNQAIDEESGAPANSDLGNQF